MLWQMNKLCVTTLESKFRLFDMRTYHDVHGYSSKAIKVRMRWNRCFLSPHAPLLNELSNACLLILTAQHGVSCLPSRTLTPTSYSPLFSPSPLSVLSPSPPPLALNQGPQIHGVAGAASAPEPRHLDDLRRQRRAQYLPIVCSGEVCRSE